MAKKRKFLIKCIDLVGGRAVGTFNTVKEDALVEAAKEGIPINIDHDKKNIEVPTAIILKEFGIQVIR